MSRTRAASTFGRKEASASGGGRGQQKMNTDVVIVGAGPAGIFTALEMLKKGSKKKIVIVEMCIRDRNPDYTCEIWIAVKEKKN